MPPTPLRLLALKRKKKTKPTERVATEKAVMNLVSRDVYIRESCRTECPWTPVMAPTRPPKLELCGTDTGDAV